jgi:hypothetical protein
MGARCCRALIGSVCLSLAGCAAQAPQLRSEEVLAQLRSGRASPSCREACLNDWRREQPQAAQLDAAGRGQDLAMLVLRVGYQDDLSLYYLGRAAEGMGYRSAAASYYRQSVRLSATAESCQYLSRLCGGVSLPRAALSRAAALDRELMRHRARPAGGAPGSEPPAAASEEIGEPLPPPMPPPATPPPPMPSPPRAIQAGPPPSEYIEPPPAMR